MRRGEEVEVARDALFDLAINRSLVYAERFGVLGQDRERLRGGLELWYLKTRFAYRIPLETVVEVLQTHPGGEYYWTGGQAGTWKKGRNPRP